MAEKRSEASRYKSQSTGDYITCGQYIAEILCYREAEKAGSGTPAFKFWSTPKWEKIFRRKVTEAYKFIREFGEEAVITFLKSNAGKNVYSFGFPDIKEKIAKVKIELEAKEKMERERAKIEVVPVAPIDVEQKPRPTFSKSKSLLSQVKKGEVSNGKEGEGR